MYRIIQILLVLLIFQDYIYDKIPMFSNFEEIVMVLAIIYIFILLTMGRKKIVLSKYDIISFILLILYSIVGIISNFKYELLDISKAFLSLILTIKGYLLYFSFRIIFKYYKIDYKILKPIVKLLKISLYLFAGIGLINLPFGFLKTSGIRFGISTVAIGFSHVTELAFFSILSMCIILFYNACEKNKKDEKKVLLATFILVILSGRSKAIGFIAIFLLLYIIMKKARKLKISQIIILSPIALYIGVPRIYSELVTGARGELYRTSIAIAGDNWPLGSGFGTFGSHISRVYYSPLYYKYGISNFWGLSPQMPKFIVDTYWAMVLGECGYIGLVLMIGCIFFIFIQFFKSKFDKTLKLPMVGLIIYTLVSSIAEPIYSSNKSAILFIILALFISVDISRVPNR